jgi:hypothetical protein
MAAESEDDLAAAAVATPRPPEDVARLAARILSASTLAKHCIAWACVSLALWALGTMAAIVTARGVLALGFGGLAAGVAAGAVAYAVRRREAHAIAREAQLVTATFTSRRSHETLGTDVRETLGASLLGETYQSVVFALGFIRYEVRAPLADRRAEGERCSVLVQPGARHALVFDTSGRGHLGALLRIG